MALDVDVYHRDYGVTIKLNCRTDVSDATSWKMLVKNMSTGVITQINAALDTNDHNCITHVVPSVGSAFAAYGRYQIRSYVTFSGSQAQQGDPVELVVGESWTITA